MSELLTAREVQELLKVDRITVYRMLNDGRLKGIKIGNQWRFQAAEIQRLLGEEKNDENSSEDVPSLLDFPFDCVTRLQDIYAGILGIGAVTVNLKGSPLTRPTIANPFCKLILENESGIKACQESWCRVAARTASPNAFHICHAGLCYFRAPIVINQRMSAWAISGQFYAAGARQDHKEIRLAQIARSYSIPLNQLSEAEEGIPVLNKQQQQKVKEWTPRVAETIQSFICERSELVDRLQRIAELSSITTTLK